MSESDVLAMLTADHRRVEDLFARFEQSADPEVALEICRELTVHATLEEELVYPVLATKVEGGHGRAMESRHEHQEAKQLISRIEAGAAGGDDVSSLVGELQQAMQHHVEEEEREIFPMIRTGAAAVVKELGDDMVHRKEELQGQMAEAREHGLSPSSVSPKPPAVT
jgi:iron-sulfur cluster repair protein YtfE (RIC family)